MHALVFRKWKQRVKGRDWYDFEWYVRNNVKLNFTHLQERIRQFEGIEMSKEELVRLLKERLATTDIEMVKRCSAVYKEPTRIGYLVKRLFLAISGYDSV